MVPNDHQAKEDPENDAFPNLASKPSARLEVWKPSAIIEFSMNI